MSKHKQNSKQPSNKQASTNNILQAIPKNKSRQEQAKSFKNMQADKSKNKTRCRSRSKQENKQATRQQAS